MIWDIMLGGSKLFAFVTVLIIVSSASATYHFLSDPEDVLESDEEPGLLEEEESEWHYRIPVEVHSGMYEREDRVVSQIVNVTKEIGGMGNYDENSLRLHETNETWYPMWETVFQERWLDEDRVEVSWLLNGTTPANNTRYFMLKFDTVENGPKPPAESFDPILDIDEDENHIWVRGDDYEVKVDTQRGGSRVVKYDDGTRKGYVFDTTWMSWHSDNMNWREKGAEVEVAAAGPLYVELNITSSCGTEGYTWYFYSDSMGVELKNESRQMSFDTIADNVINTDGTLVWSNGHSENLTRTNLGSQGKPNSTPSSGRGPPDEVSPGPPGDDDSPPGRRYSTHRNVTDFFYIIGPEDKETDKSAGFWAVPEDGLMQTVYCAGEKGLRWEMKGTGARFGFADYEDTRNVTLAHQHSPTVSRSRTQVHLVSPVVRDEIKISDQHLRIEGDLKVVTDAELKMDDTHIRLAEKSSFFTLLGSSTEIHDSEIYFENAGWGASQLASYGGLKLTRSSVYTDEGHYLRVFLRDRSVIRSSRFRHLRNGVEVDSEDVEIYDVDIRYSMGAGILVTEGYSPVLQGGEIRDCSYGIRTGAVPENHTYYPAEAEFSISKDNPEVGEQVNFNCETSKTHEDMELYRSWNFGDGNTDTGEDTDHAYLTSGSYTAQLTVRSEVHGYIVGITTETKEITVYSTDVPTAAFGIDYPEEGGVEVNPKTHQDISFNDNSGPAGDGSELVEWRWDLGDGTQKIFGGSTTVIHSYSDPGTYTVSLTVEDDVGRTNSQSKEVEVIKTTPTPDIDVEPEYVQPGSEVLLDGSGSSARDGDIESWTWTYIYDDNEYSIGEGEQVNHSFNWAAHFTVKLKVEDEYGTTASTSKLIKVGRIPVAEISEHRVVSELEKKGDEWVSTITLDGSDSNPGGDQDLVYDWDLPEDADVLSDGEEIKYELSYSEEERIRGVYFVNLTIEDGEGYTDSTYTRVVEYFPDDGSHHTISGFTFKDNGHAIFLGGDAPSEGSGVQNVGEIVSGEEYVNIFNSRIYDNDYGIYSYWTDFAIRDTHIFDNRIESIALNNAILIPVTGGYDRREHKMDFIFYERFPDRDYDEDFSGDGFVWTDEIWRYGFNPWFEDSYDTNTDGEWLPNVEQADVYGTDPLSPDTDGDGVSDRLEIEGWSWDIDEDEGWILYHDSDGFITDPLNPDTDFDGWYDGLSNRDAILLLWKIDVHETGDKDVFSIIVDDTRHYPGYDEFWEFTPGDETSGLKGHDDLPRYDDLKADAFGEESITDIIDVRVETDSWPGEEDSFSTPIVIKRIDAGIIKERINLKWTAPEEASEWNLYEYRYVTRDIHGNIRRDYTFHFISTALHFPDLNPVDFDHEHDASSDGISDADTYRLSSDPLIDGRAHPLRKDVFVEVDWMEGVDRLSDEAKWRIGTRFYENDIWLHIDDGKMDGGGELDDYEEKIRNSNWGLDRGYFYHQEKPGFHYSLLAYRHEEDSFLNQIRGNAPSPGRRFAIYTKRASGTDWQVHVFLHEIGHNLIGRYYVDNPDHPRHNPLANHFVYEDDRDYRVHCGCDDCALRQGSWSPRSDFCGNCWGAMNFQWDGWRSR